MATILDEFVLRWTQPPFSYILLAIAIVIICYIFFRKFYEPTMQRFKGEGIGHVIKELNITPNFAKFSRKCKKGKLYHNMGVVDIERVMMTKVKGTKGKKVKDKDKDDYSFIMFKTATSLIAKIPIFSKFKGDVEYFVINNNSNYIEKNKYADTWIVKPNVYMHKFADVWICSAEGTNFLTELVYKRTYENAREEEMNYIKRVVWYNDMYASKMTRDFIEHDIEQDSYESRIERETGVRKR